MRALIPVLQLELRCEEDPIMRTTFVVFLVAGTLWVGCGNPPPGQGAATTDARAGNGGSGGTPEASGGAGGTPEASGDQGADESSDGGEKSAPAMPCAMAGACTDICSGGCIFNADKMRTECTAAQSRCSGTCGNGCDLQCGGASACNVTVAAGGSFECKGATCDITVGDAKGSVECSGAGTTCNITCQGDCSFECAKGATCNVRCGSAAAMTTTTSGGCGKGGDTGDKGGDQTADAGQRP